MTALRMTYADLRFDDLRGELLSDYLIALDAHLVVVDDDQVLIDEPSFPVVELARSLSAWLENECRGSYWFDSMSYEELGAVHLTETPDGWTIGSTLSPGSESGVYEWGAIEQCVRAFIDHVKMDLTRTDLDAAEIVGR